MRMIHVQFGCARNIYMEKGAGGTGVRDEIFAVRAEQCTCVSVSKSRSSTSPSMYATRNPQSTWCDNTRPVKLPGVQHPPDFFLEWTSELGSMSVQAAPWSPNSFVNSRPNNAEGGGTLRLSICGISKSKISADCATFIVALLPKPKTETRGLQSSPELSIGP